MSSNVSRALKNTLLAAVATPWLLAIAQAAQTQPPATADASSSEFFEAHIRPVFAANCYDCHTEEALGGLRLDSRDGMLKGGKSGPAIVPGNPDASLLVQAIRQTGALKMPKGGRLRPDEVDAITAWIRAGAVWPAPVTTTATTATA